VLTHVLQPDTQAILLLCAGFGQSRQVEPMPLSLSEYNALARKLHQDNLRPADLLTTEGKDWVFHQINTDLSPHRIIQLLERGAMLAVAVENWTSKGLWILSRIDETYPQRLKQKLKHLAPPILYGVGNQDLLSAGGLAVVGSRDIDNEAIEYSQRIAEKCAEQGIQIVSGGARGVDQTAMLAAISSGGKSVGILADNLIKAAVAKNYREGLREGRVALISPYDPSAGFNVGNTMNRNKYIYALADHALVISSSYEEGGTWAGATEELKRDNRIPVWVRLEGDVPQGNHQLVKLGAIPFPLQPWNRRIWDLLAENYDNTSKGLALNKANQTENKLDNISSQNRELTSELPKDAYEAVLPLLLHHLQEPKGEKELAKLLDVGVGQIRLWLKKGIQQKIVDKKKTRYVLNCDNKQLHLLSLH